MKRNFYCIILLGLLLAVLFSACTAEPIEPMAGEMDANTHGEDVTDSETDTEAETEPQILCDVHTFGEWTLVTTPSCAAEGSEASVCINCSYTVFRALPKIEEHFFTDAGDCDICGELMPEGFVFTKNSGGESYSVRYQGEEASVVIPSTYNGLPVTSLGSGAFFFQSNLRSVTLPDCMEEIGERAFASCAKLERVNTPKSLKVIGQSAFSGCAALKTFEIPQTVTRIEYYTFANSGIKAPNLHDKLTYIGDYAFQGCPNLLSIKLPASVEMLGEGAFTACSSLKTVEISKNTKLKVIPANAFSASRSLNRVVIAEGIEEIGDQAFSANLNLSSVSLPSTLRCMGDQVFFGAANVLNITFNGSEEQWNTVSIGDRWIQQSFTTVHMQFQS